MQKNKPHFKVSFSIFVSVIVCSLLFVFALMSSAAETAPGQNDTTGTATRINVNQTYSDNIVKSSDVDYFTFTTSSAGYVQLEFTHGLLTDTSNNWYVYLYDSNLQEIGKIDVPGNITSKKTAQTGISAGTYYIKVEDGWNYSDITYQIKAIYSSSNYWEKEKNETAQTANSISLNATYSGAVYKSSDVDFYTFTTSSAGYVQLDFTHELLTDTYNNWYIYLYESNLKEIGKIEVPGNITSKKTAQAGIPAGTYYIKVTSGWDHSDVSYQIKAVYSSSNYWEKELNEDVATANTISVNTAYSGSVYKSSDVDFYTFTTSNAGYVQLELTHAVLTDTYNNWYIYLYESNLQEIGKIEVPGNITSKQSAQIGIPAGKYYIKVTAGWNHSDITYQIKTIYNSSSYWEKERNEDTATATSISLNSKYSGSVYKSSDVDYFTFSTTSTGYVQLEFTHEAFSDSYHNWYVYLYTSNLEKVIELQSRGNESSTVSDQVSISSGTYYVKVEDGWSHSPITYGIKVKSSSASTYTVSYNANGGTGAPSSQTVTAGNSITIPSTAPTWTGHQFLGWSTSSSATTASYVAGNTYKPSGNTTFYAVWKQNSTTSYTVSYSANGGSGAPSSQTVTAGSSVTIPSTIPTRFPYTFLGWSTSSSASSASYLPGGSYTPGSSTTLYAVWKSATTVSGSTTVTTNISVAGTLVYYKLTPSVSGTLTVESTGSYDTYGYLYSESGSQLTYKDQGGTNNNFKYTYSVTAGTTYYAAAKLYSSSSTGSFQTVFTLPQTVSYTVSYNANGGSGAPSSQTVTAGNSVTIPSTIPTRFPYTFLGWSTSSSASSASYLPGGSYTPGSSTTLYAVWKSATTVSGSTTVTTSISAAGSRVYYKLTPSASGTLTVESTGSNDTYGYLFDASGSQLTYNDDGGTNSNFKYTYSVTAGTTYYAAAKLYSSSSTGSFQTVFTFPQTVSYTVSYNANGGSGAPSSQTVTAGNSVTIPTTAPNWTGHKFLGWSTSSSATSASYNAGGTFKPSGNTTLYAVWRTLYTYTVSYNANGGSGAPSSQTKTEDSTLTLSSTKPTKQYKLTYNANGGTVSPSSKTVTCTFNGWNTASDGSGTSYASGGSYSNNASATLYAKWSNPSAGSLPTPTRDWDTFDGWYTSSTGGTRVYSSTVISASKTLYAHWTPHSHTWDKGVVNTPATYTSEGLQTFTCTVCKETKTEVIPKKEIIPLKVTVQPKSVAAADQSVATFKVVAEGSELTYAWRYRISSSDSWIYCTSATEGYNTDTLKVVAASYRNGYQYQCVIRDVVGSVKYSYDVTLSVKTLSVTGQPTGTTVSDNSTATFKVTASGVGITYAWRVRTSKTADWTYLTSATEGYNKDTLKVTARLAMNGYRYQCVMKDGGGTVKYSHDVMLSVVPQLTITSHPTSATAAANGKATFSVSATGSGVTYAWRTRANSSASWTYLTSATEGYNTATLKVPATMDKNGYRYQCVVRDSIGKVKYSRDVALTVKELSFTSQPASACVTENTAATLKVTAAGVGVTYAWRMRTSSSAGWTNCTSATSGYNTNTLKITAKSSMNGYRYQCVIRDAAGTVKYSRDVALTVVPPLTVTSQPSSVTVTAGSAATFSVTASGTGLTYAWRTRANSSASWTYLMSATEGFNTATLKVSASLDMNGRQYQCVIRDAAGAVKYSYNVTMNVVQPMAITAHPTSVTAVEGSTATFKVTATGSGLTYRWRYRINSSGTWVYCTSATEGYNTNTLKVLASDYRNGYQYQCVITDATGAVKYSRDVTLTVTIPPLTVTSQPQSVSAMENAKVTFKVTATGTGLTYAWRTRSSKTGDWVYCTSSTPGYNTNAIQVTAKASLNGSQYQCVITDASGKKAYTSIVTLTLE